MKVRQKQQKDENFPVEFCLIRPEYRALIRTYYNFARQADDIADNPKLSPQKKLEKLNKIEKILYGEKYSGKEFLPTLELRKMFMENNFSFSLATDLLIAFRQDAENFQYQTWGQLIEYCRYSAAPVGRFMLALYNESPSTYQPAASLCTALQLVNHLQDAHYDALTLKRVYFPEILRHKYGIEYNDLIAKAVSPNLRKAADEVINNIEELLKEAEVLPIITKSMVLRIEINVIIYLTKTMIYKLKSEDFLAHELKLSVYDWVIASLKGLLKGIFTKPRTLRTKGL